MSIDGAPLHQVLFRLAARAPGLTLEGLTTVCATYLPVVPFDLRTEVSLTISASDLDGNAMTPVTCSFIVTDGLDLDYDGLYDDWGDYYGIEPLDASPITS